MVDFYIYYRVRDDVADQLAPRVCAMQAALDQRHGVRGQLKRRPGSKQGLQTWMEVYTGAADGFDEALQAAVEEANVADLIEGERHTEVFMDLNSCA